MSSLCSAGDGAQSFVSAKQAVSLFIGHVTFTLILIPNRTYFGNSVSLIYHGLVSSSKDSQARLRAPLIEHTAVDKGLSTKLNWAPNFKLFLVTLAVLPVSLIGRVSRRLCTE